MPQTLTRLPYYHPSHFVKMASQSESSTSQKKKLTDEQKARLASDVTKALKQMEEDEVKQKNLKLLSEKLLKENQQYKVENETIFSRLIKVEAELAETQAELVQMKTELAETRKELFETKEEVAETKKELDDTKKLLLQIIAEQEKQKQIIIALSEHLKLGGRSEKE